MKKFKNYAFLGFGVAMVLSISGCVFGGKPVIVTPEGTMPQDLSVVVALDHSNMEQVALLKEIVARVPSMGFWDDLVKEIDASSGLFTYTANKELIESSWKIVFGLKLPSDPTKLGKLMTDSNFTLGSDGVDIYVAGQFAMPDKVQVLLDEIVKKDGKKMEFLADEKNPTWRVKQGSENFMIVRMKDVYFMTISSAQKDEILKRIDEGMGFDKSLDYQKNLKLLGEKNLGYFYLDMKLVSGIYSNLLKNNAGALPNDVLGIMKGLWAVFSVEKNGPNFISKIYFDGDKTLIDKYYPNYKLSLVDKIPAKGVIFYEEMPSLGLYLESFFKGISAVFKASSAGNELNAQIATEGESANVVKVEKPISREKGYKSLPIVDKPVVEPVVEEVKPVSIASVETLLAAEDLYGAVLEQAGGISGLTADDLKKIFDSPYAFVVSDVGGYIPAVTLYLQVNKDSVENAKKLVAGASTYMDAVIAGLNVELKRFGLDGIIKKDVKMVDGATLQKVYIDWAALPAPKIKELSDQFGVDLLSVKVQVYYGVLNDGMFVFAVYPDFVDDYGKDVLSGVDYYKEMRARAGEVYGGSVVFFRMTPVLDLVGRYFELAKKMGAISEESDQDMMLSYELYTKIISSFDYIFISGLRDLDGVRSSASLKIKEVQLSPELLKKMEAAAVEKKAADEALMKMYQEAAAAK